MKNILPADTLSSQCTYRFNWQTKQASFDTSTLTQIKTLLTSVKRVADHQAELRRLKGEDFNLFLHP